MRELSRLHQSLSLYFRRAFVSEGSRLGVGLGIVAFFLTIFCSGEGLAQGNFDGRLLGGRTSMMGGAGVAMGSDQATAFINPAGITRIPGQKYSVSRNSSNSGQYAFSTFAGQFESRSIKNYYDPSQELNLEKENAVDLSLRVVPNTFCLFLDGPPKDSYSGRSRHKFAACGADTESENYFYSRTASSVNDAGVSRGVSNQTAMSFKRSSFALTWGLQLTERLSVGTNFRIDYAAFTNQVSSSAFTGNTSSATSIVADVNRNSWSWGTSVTIGATYRLFDGVTIGGAFSTPSQHIFGSHTGSTNISSPKSSRALFVQDEGDFRYNSAGQLRVGMAFSWPTFNFEINAAFYGAQEEIASASFERTTNEVSGASLVSNDLGRRAIVERGQPVTNLFAGFETFLANDFSLIAGLNTDFSSLTKRKATELADSLFMQRKHALYASVGVMSYGSAGSLLLGFRSHYGWGEVLSPDILTNAPQFVAQRQSDASISLVVSGQINFKAVRDTALRAVAPLGQISSSLSSAAPPPKAANPYRNGQ